MEHHPDDVKEAEQAALLKRLFITAGVALCVPAALAGYGYAVGAMKGSTLYPLLVAHLAIKHVLPVSLITLGPIGWLLSKGPSRATYAHTLEKLHKNRALELKS